MERVVGTIARGIRAPIIREGDDIAEIVTQSVIAAAEREAFALRDRDVIAVTEAVVARAQGNYATLDHIAADIKAKFGMSNYREYHAVSTADNIEYLGRYPEK